MIKVITPSDKGHKKVLYIEITLVPEMDLNSYNV